MELVDIPEDVLKVFSLDEEVTDQWCLVMFISFEDPTGHKSVSTPVYIGLLANNQQIITEEDVLTHLKAEWEKPPRDSNIVITLCKSLLQTPKFDDLSVARKIIKVLTRVIDWETWPAEVAQDLPSPRPEEKIAGVQIIPLKLSLMFDLEHALTMGVQQSIKDLVADIQGLDSRLLVPKIGHA